VAESKKSNNSKIESPPRGCQRVFPLITNLNYNRLGRALKFWDLVSSILTRLPWGRIGNNYSKIVINTVYFKISPVHQKKCSHPQTDVHSLGLLPNKMYIDWLRPPRLQLAGAYLIVIWVVNPSKGKSARFFQL